MAGIKIIGVKVVGICSKCRKEGDEIPKNKDGSIIPDKEISCVNTAFGNCVTDDRCPEGRRMKKLIHIDDCGVEATVTGEGWVTIMDENGSEISLGYYPNKRFEIVEKAIAESKLLEQEKHDE